MDDNDLESGLRRVLHDRSRRVPDTQIPLERVYAGAGRRRARRRAATAVAGASAFVVAVAGVAAWHVLGTAGTPRATAAGPVASSDSTPATPSSQVSPSASASSTGPSATSSAVAQLPVPAGFMALSVTAISASHWWVLGTDGLVAATVDGGRTFALTGPRGLGSGARTVRFANSADGWAVTAAAGSVQGLTLWSTVDGGRTWAGVPGLDGAASAVEAGAGYVFATTQRSDGTWSVWSSAIGSSVWHRLGNLGVIVTNQTPLLAVQSGRAVVVGSNTDKVRAWVFSPDGTQTTLATPCTPDVGTADLSATSGPASSVWLVCHTGMADALYRSTDGATWTAVPGATPVSSRLRVGAIDPTHAAVGLQDGSIRQVTTTSSPVSNPASVSGAHSGGWSYIAFTNPSDGFAIDDFGVLLRTVNGGGTWSPVRFR
jgi:photosystem II stability/assembly factor-like uncharacterized protein